MTKNIFHTCKPKSAAPLDPGYTPPVLAHRAYQQLVEEAGSSEQLVFALERENGLVARFETQVLAMGGDHDAATLRYAERIVKFLLWSRGGWRLYVGGPKAVGQYIATTYAPEGQRAFDIDLMERIYEKPFGVVACSPDDVPDEKELGSALGGHWEGCRIGFDLGASDHKIAAVIDGEPVYSDEIPWHPLVETDLDYHYSRITAALKKAASHMPRVDAIGGSSAGVYVDNRVMVASLFRSIPKERFDQQVKPLFLRIREEWGVPMDVVNDVDVTALAGALSLEKNAMLGIAMGSSEAVGYLNRDGRITGWLNELAFAPVDFSPEAKPDEWSGDEGVGAMYFSQQAVNRLAPAAGFTFPDEMLLPERLKEVQAKMHAGDQQASLIFKSIGVYLGYTLPYYREFYDFDNALILGRVSSGTGGDIIIDTAQQVLQSEFPEIAEQMAIHVPDEKSRRVGQAVAAASLPALG